MGANNPMVLVTTKRPRRFGSEHPAERQ